MLFRAIKTCTNFDGRYLVAGAVVDLPPEEKRSRYLVPVHPAAAEEPPKAVFEEPEKTRPAEETETTKGEPEQRKAPPRRTRKKTS